jgi:hypothetical protein
MIATTHVGRLPRGPELAPLLLARDGKIDPAVAWKKLAALRAGADIADQRIG